LSEKTRKKLVFGILILALIWAYFNFAGPGKKSAPKPRTAAAIKPVRAGLQVSSETGFLPDSVYQSYDNKAWGRNPFYSDYRISPTETPVLPAQIELHLLGVVYRASRAHALINNKIVTVGDSLEGFRITDIYRDSVIVNDGVNRITLVVTKESS
jgi:hypothetical protein